MRKEVVYFADQSYNDKKIAIEVLRLALNRAKELGIKRVVVPSSTGWTAFMAVKVFENSGIELIVVSERAGAKFSRKWYEEYAKKRAHLPADEVQNFLKVMGFKDEEIKAGLSWKPEVITKLRHKGVKVTISSEAFRSMLLSRVHPTFVVAQTLGLFGRGTRVAVEVVLAACDAGFVEAGEEVIALGGLSKGVDSALVVRACHRDEIFSETGKELQIREIICKPRLK